MGLRARGAFFLTQAALLRAQAPTGTIQGRVQDWAAAGIAAAQVMIVGATASSPP